MDAFRETGGRAYTADTKKKVAAKLCLMTVGKGCAVSSATCKRTGDAFSLPQSNNLSMFIGMNHLKTDMKRVLFSLVMLLVAVQMFGATPAHRVYDLRCCHASNGAFIATTEPTFGWKILAQEQGFMQSAYQLVVAESESGLEGGATSLWNSGRVRSDESVAVGYQGKALSPGRQYFWKVRVWDNHGKASAWSASQTFSTALMAEHDWQGAQWIALEEDRPEWRAVPGCHLNGEAKKRFGNEKTGMYRLPQFRKELVVDKDVSRVTAYVAGLGQFDFFMNGEKVGNHFLDAAWTKYDRHAEYVAFDVSHLLRKGRNALGVMLGNGFYNIPRERYFKLLTSFGSPKMRLLLDIEYADGSRERIVSDQTWRVTESPITYSSIYGGEDYDARRETAGWQQSGFDDSLWQEPVVCHYEGRLSLQTSDPLIVHSELPVQQVLTNSRGQKVYDLGQNFSGIVRIKVKSAEPKTIVLRPAELLNVDTTVNQSATGEPYYFSYTTRGGGETETWQPQFSYYGFRYVQVEGEGVELLELAGLHTCNAAEKVGSFSCSKPLFNKTNELIDWAVRSNTASLLTDCPTREKLGWLEQAHLMQHSLLYNYDLLLLYRKIMEDMRQSQREDGCIPSICPEYVRFADGFEDSPEWGSSFIICPWYIYKWYGDASLLREYYPDMQRYLAYLDSRAKDDIVAYGLGDWFDIGLKRPGRSQLTDLGVTSTAMYYYTTHVMAQAAKLIGKKEDALKYEQKAEEIRKAFWSKYFHQATRVIDRNSQTANAIALYFGLADEEQRETLIENLVNDIRQRGNALTAGDVGYRYVLRVLEEAGRSDVIFDMNNRYDVPGYGWQLAHGATALTESWQAYGFVSNNHFMLGHLMEWFYSGLGGIRQAENSTGWKEIVIAPQPVGDVKEANTEFESPHGTIRCHWRLTSKTNVVKVEIPANTTATVVLPGTGERKKIGSGEYSFYY